MLNTNKFVKILLWELHQNEAQNKICKAGTFENTLGNELVRELDSSESNKPYQLFKLTLR